VADDAPPSAPDPMSNRQAIRRHGLRSPLHRRRGPWDPFAAQAPRPILSSPSVPRST